MIGELVAGRECGSCNVCCVHLTIDDPELQKPQGYRCRNANPDHSCAIYERRPKTCKDFYCGWRTLKWVRQPLRPDVSDVLVRLQFEKPQGEPPPQLGVVFTLLTARALKADGLAETVAAAVAANVPVYLHVPGPPGYTASQARINDVLQHAVLTRDKAGVLDVLRRARIVAQGGKRTPIVLKNMSATDQA